MTRIAKEFGQQCIVSSANIKHNANNKHYICVLIIVVKSLDLKLEKHLNGAHLK